MTSLATVHGKDTDFTRELERGDTIIVYNEKEKEEEKRKVTMVLSNKSLGIDEAFNRDISISTPFKFQKKPKRIIREKPIEELVEEEMKKISDSKREDKSTGGKRVIEYRTTAGPWTYKKVTEEVDEELTKEQELDLRVKKTRDKFCWY